jgi:hypothetical protein
MKVGDMVRVVRASAGFDVGDVHEVAVVVEKGTDYHGTVTTPGVILKPYKDKHQTWSTWSYPFVWDMDRFEVVEQRWVAKP